MPPLSPERRRSDRRERRRGSGKTVPPRASADPIPARTRLQWPLRPWSETGAVAGPRMPPPAHRPVCGGRTSRPDPRPWPPPAGRRPPPTPTAGAAKTQSGWERVQPPLAAGRSGANAWRPRPCSRDRPAHALEWRAAPVSPHHRRSRKGTAGAARSSWPLLGETGKQHLPGPVCARHHRADRDPQLARHLCVASLLDRSEIERRRVLLRQLAEGQEDGAQLSPDENVVLDWTLPASAPLDVGGPGWESDGVGVQARGSSLVQIRVAKDAEEPRPQVGARSERAQRSQGPNRRLLSQIRSFLWISCQGPGKP